MKEEIWGKTAHKKIGKSITEAIKELNETDDNSNESATEETETVLELTEEIPVKAPKKSKYKTGIVSGCRVLRERASADTNSAIIALLKEDTVVEVRDYNDEWYETNKSTYLKKNYVKMI